jgi:hypothetical protein
VSAYRRLKRVLWASFAIYALAGIYQQMAMRGVDRERLFPLASWALFAKVPAQITDFSVRLLEIDGVPLARPRWADSATDRLPGLASLDAYRLIQQLGRAVQAGDRNTAERARRALEGIYLRGASPFRYEVVRRSYDPLERWRSGVVRATQPLDQFDSRTAP